jgi:hypothetical protein
MLVVERDEGLVLDDENAADMSFTLTEQHLELGPSLIDLCA